MERGSGSRIWDVDGNEYIDYALALGPIIHGHCPPRIIEAVVKVLNKGPWQNPPTELLLKTGEKFKEITKNDMVRFTNSGTEATMNAMRLARAYTGREKVLMFEGGYHGGYDYALCTHPPLKPIGGNRWLSNNPYLMNVFPDSMGIPQKVLDTVMVAPWNNVEVLEKTIENHADELACVMTEPVLMNIGCVQAEKGYLETMRKLTEKNGIILMFDEVITGFRLALGGGQEYLGIRADLATYAKALSGGFPIGAIGGKKEIMSMFVPGKVVHFGTMNANPVCLAATQTSLEMLSENSGAALRDMNKRGDRLIAGIREAIETTKQEAIVQGIHGAGLQLYFTPLKKIANYRDYLSCNKKKFALFHKELLKRGIYIHPSQNEHFFLSTAHSDQDIEKTISAIKESLSVLPKESRTTESGLWFAPQ
jgi:glutamate-1-semialdehyde 2,1-aminomutase